MSVIDYKLKFIICFDSVARLAYDYVGTLPSLIYGISTGANFKFPSRRQLKILSIFVSAVLLVPTTAYDSLQLPPIVLCWYRATALYRPASAVDNNLSVYLF